MRADRSPEPRPPSLLDFFTSDTFDSAKLKSTALAELACAFLITQSDLLRRLPVTTELTAQHWGLALLSAIALLLLWELGKWIARPERAGLATSFGQVP